MELKWIRKDSLVEELLNIFHCHAGIKLKSWSLLGKLSYTINHLPGQDSKDLISTKQKTKQTKQKHSSS